MHICRSAHFPLTLTYDSEVNYCKIKDTGLLLRCLHKTYQRPACGVTPKNSDLTSKQMKVTELLFEIIFQNLPTRWPRVPPAEVAAGSARRGGCGFHPPRWQRVPPATLSVKENKRQDILAGILPQSVFSMQRVFVKQGAIQYYGGFSLCKEGGRGCFALCFCRKAHCSYSVISKVKINFKGNGSHFFISVLYSLSETVPPVPSISYIILPSRSF